MVKYLSKNKYSRPCRKLNCVRGVVMHWTGSPNMDENQVRRYFEEDCPKVEHYASAHYIIGQTGKVLNIIPTDEMSYHCGSSIKDPESGEIYTDKAREMFGNFASFPNTLSPNQCTIGIEMCPIDKEGHFSNETLDAAEKVVKELLVKFGLDMDDITTHHEVVGWKDCPKIWTDYPELFEIFKERFI